MLKKILVAVVGLTGMMCANATPIQIDATGTAHEFVSTSDWSLIYEDTGDGLLQVDEIVWFSGASVTIFGFDLSYDTILGTPNLAGISTQSGLTLGLHGLFWWLSPGFGPAPANAWFAARWTYDVRPIDAVSVPEPGTLGLLGLGLMGLYGARKRSIV